MKRVVITGLGITSCLGNTKADVTDALRSGRCGISERPEYRELGMRSQVAAKPEVDFKADIDRRQLRFMGDAAAYACLAMRDAIDDAGLDAEQISNPRIGLIAGSGGHSSENQVKAADIARNRSVKRVGAYMVPRVMASTVSACLSNAFKIKGVNYSIGSACATSAHCIGNAAEQIQLGKQDIVFAGGGEEEHWALSILFDGMGALSSQYNDTPETASRPYDANRDGFVIAGGGGILVLEELEHAQARGAHIYAELVGYGATSDGYNMVAPSGEGAARCMQQAMAQCDDSVDYINAHGTSTPVGDIAELGAIREVFGDKAPYISSTKALSGHSLGAAGVHEAIYSILMMEAGFIAGSAHIETLDPEADGLPILQQRLDQRPNLVLSNSFGFGGTNASLLLKRWRDNA